MTLSPIIVAHMVPALAALPLGAYVIASRKGGRWHKVAGRAWAGLMLVVAITSFWITGLNGRHWSPIHLLSALTLAGLVWAVWQVRRGNVRSHRRAMTWLFVSLCVAGAWAALPGRTFGNLLWS